MQVPTVDCLFFNPYDGWRYTASRFTLRATEAKTMQAYTGSIPCGSQLIRSSLTARVCKIRRKYPDAYVGDSHDQKYNFK